MDGKAKPMDCEKKERCEQTINDIIKRSMTQRHEAIVNENEEQEEYVPTMKEKFLLS